MLNSINKKFEKITARTININVLFINTKYKLDIKIKKLNVNTLNCNNFITKLTEIINKKIDKLVEIKSGIGKGKYINININLQKNLILNFNSLYARTININLITKKKLNNTSLINITINSGKINNLTSNIINSTPKGKEFTNIADAYIYGKLITPNMLPKITINNGMNKLGIIFKKQLNVYIGNYQFRKPPENIKKFITNYSCNICSNSNSINYLHIIISCSLLIILYVLFTIIIKKKKFSINYFKKIINE